MSKMSILVLSMYSIKNKNKHTQKAQTEIILDRWDIWD